ncbi:hypothetical protein D9Q98_000273 [Chlorella vulgaris]|uniref:Uncharacterized protein n=1 Tax=Chlorella vulgaris TaxID=3077 RepID=A0A9D4TXW6_CHLVU|nr:hypothetical protein D9Q98_000273 [Chlorella vulgaris]
MQHTALSFPRKLSAGLAAVAFQGHRSACVSMLVIRGLLATGHAAAQAAKKARQLAREAELSVHGMVRRLQTQSRRHSHQMRLQLGCNNVMHDLIAHATAGWAGHHASRAGG